MLNIKIESGGKKIIYKPFSVAVKYLVDSKKLKNDFLNLERVFNMKFSELQKKNILSDKITKVHSINPSGKPDELIVFKVKIDENFNADYFRNQLAEFIAGIENQEVKALHIFIPDYEIFKGKFDSVEYYYQTFVEGIYYGSYSFNTYKKDPGKRRDLKVVLYSGNAKKLNSAIITGGILMDAVFFARDLQNEPSNNLTPRLFSNRLKEKLSSTGITINVLREKELLKLKMQGILSVGKGSTNPPELVKINYRPRAVKKQKSVSVVLVGKGIMFDSGGISIKPSQHMWEMKADMSGAAVAAAVIHAASRAKLKTNITCILPTAENMPSGSSYKPGDIITASSGKTIEVDDTDAEGRIILADALHYASKMKPDMIIDLATLTGACVVALGEFVAGLFTKDDKLSEQLIDSSAVTEEKLWRMPMWDAYHRLNKSELADVKNYGGKWGGAVSAAKFLENFVDKKIPWAHLDIAGPAMPNDSTEYTKKYMTGFGVRLLFDFLSRLEKK